MPKTDRDKAKELYRRRVSAAMERADEAFRGKYAAEITALLSLSKEQIDAIAPGEIDLRTYDVLIEVVKEASRVNLAQAELVKRIEAMGEVAVEIAKKVPRLAALFA
jgi:hypothetical protein